MSARSSSVGIGMLAMFTFTAGLIPPVQLRCTAYHVFEFRRDVDHFLSISFCKADARFPSRGGESDARGFGVFLHALLERFSWRDNTDNAFLVLVGPPTVEPPPAVLRFPVSSPALLIRTDFEQQP